MSRLTEMKFILTKFDKMDVLHCYVTRLILQTVLLAISSHDD